MRMEMARTLTFMLHEEPLARRLPVAVKRDRAVRARNLINAKAVFEARRATDQSK